MSGAYVAYESLQKEWSGRMTWLCCDAHIRRKLEEVHFLGATRQTIKAMSFYRLLFDFEDEAREMTPEARHAFRQEKTRPLLEKFKAWIDERLTTLRPKHPLRKPINYLANRWDIFERLPTTPPSELRSLLPDQWIDANPEHRVKLREDEAQQTARAKKQRRAKRRKQLKRAVKSK